MADKVDIDFRDAFLPSMEALARGGALLVSVDGLGRASGMTFGWGSMGSVWGRPTFTVFVRHSRHTFGLIEGCGEFTVNLLPRDLGWALDYWGKHSGRNVDKWAATRLRPAPARRVRPPIVEQGILHLECRVLHRHDLSPDHLAPGLIPAYYASDDYHRAFHGEIVACYGL